MLKYHISIPPPMTAHDLLDDIFGLMGDDNITLETLEAIETRSKPYLEWMRQGNWAWGEESGRNQVIEDHIERYRAAGYERLAIASTQGFGHEYDNYCAISWDIYALICKPIKSSQLFLSTLTGDFVYKAGFEMDPSLEITRFKQDLLELTRGKRYMYGAKIEGIIASELDGMASLQIDMSQDNALRYIHFIQEAIKIKKAEFGMALFRKCKTDLNN